MLIGFHFGIDVTVKATMSVISRSDGPGGKTYVPAGQVLLDDVVLGRPGELGGVGALLLGDRGVEGEQPHRRRVDGHRRVHVGQRDAVEQRPHVAEVRDGHADLADLPAGQLVVGVVAGLRRQVEGDRQAGLTLVEVAPVQRVAVARRRVAGVGAHDPRPVAHRSPRRARRSVRRSRVDLGRDHHLRADGVHLLRHGRSVRRTGRRTAAPTGCVPGT
jgi:hypothetical protein